MALPEWVLKFKEPKTEIKKIKGGYYKYALEYKYNTQKKRTDKITGVLLGKITEKDGFVDIMLMLTPPLDILTPL